MGFIKMPGVQHAQQSLVLQRPKLLTGCECRSIESGAMHLSLSVPRVEGADLRPWVPSEHSLVISSARSHAASSSDAAKPGQDSSNVLNWDSASFLTLDMHTAAQMSVIKLQVSASLQWLHPHLQSNARYQGASG